jgi:hypothetical protein
MADFDRDELLATLSRLSDSDDATAAAAGRAAVGLLADAGLGWPDIIIAAPALAEGAPEPEADAEAEAAPATPADAAKNSEDALVLIEQLLARKSLYEGTRDDLLAYKEDIAAGEFDDADLAYLNALYARVVMGTVKTED